MSLHDINIRTELVPSQYLQAAINAQNSKEIKIKELLEKRTLPTQGWSDELIEKFVQELANLDSNNFEGKAGLGEREGRVICNLVARRHYNFAHGIGRSGDLLEAQPKAAGSTLLANLVNKLLLDLIRHCGVRSCSYCFLAPMATGMSLTLCLLALKKERPAAKYVIWSRIDQKSCFKCITTAGLQPIIVEQLPSADGQEFCTDVAKMRQHILQLEPAQVLCLFSTTSCFAPRCSDNLTEVGKLAAEFDVPHLVNNAYGLQSTYLTHQLEQCHLVGGRVDLFVQSTDKNLMVPVGGAIVAGFNEQVVRSVAKAYAGRGSSSQSLDVLMTLLSLGKDGYSQLVKERQECYKYLKKKLQEFALERGEKMLYKCNSISLALTLSSLSCQAEKLSQLGAMLYTRNISGARVVTTAEHKVIDGITFENWGAHRSKSDVPYLTAAAAIGLTPKEIDSFFAKLRVCWLRLTAETGVLN